MATDHEAARRGGGDIGSQDARQAVKTGHMRRVLAISLILAAVILLGLWMWYPRAASMSPGSEAPSAAPPANAAPATAAPATTTPAPLSGAPSSTPNPAIP